MNPRDTAIDAIWDAVEKSILYGITPKEFRHEAASAWEHLLEEAAKDARRELESQP